MNASNESSSTFSPSDRTSRNDMSRHSRSARRHSMPRPQAILSLLLLVSASGCLFEIRDEIVDYEFMIKNCLEARSAWKQCAPEYQSLENRRDFKSGFMAGYKAVAAGAGVCPPSLPPHCYWKSCYATESGKMKANAWFDGYSHGALAAEADGVAEANRIITRGGRQSGDHKTQMEMPSSMPDPTMAPHEPPLPFSDTAIPPLPGAIED